MRRAAIRCLVGLVLAVPQRGTAQTVDGYRYTMVGAQRGAMMPGQPDETRRTEVRGLLGGGKLRTDFVEGGGPFSRPGVYMLMDVRANQVLLIDSIAGQQVSFMDIMSSTTSAMPDMLSRMTLSDTSSTLEELGHGETIVGYPTRKYRLTVRYSMGVPEVPEAKTSMVQITTLHVSDAVTALDPGFATATSIALNPTGQAAKRSKLEEDILALTSNMPKGFALLTEQDIRISSPMMESALYTSMRVQELTKATLPVSAITVPAGLTPVDYFTYMMRATQQP